MTDDEAGRTLTSRRAVLRGLAVTAWAAPTVTVVLARPALAGSPPPTEPTEEPTEQPTEQPTEEPTAEPTEQPTEEPTEEPTEQPTEEPTEQPTEEPTEEPTEGPTEQPTEAPTEEPTEIVGGVVVERPTPSAPSLPAPSPTTSVGGRSVTRPPATGPARLPMTGADVPGTMAVATGLVASGAGVLREARRRAARSGQAPEVPAGSPVGEGDAARVSQPTEASEPTGSD